MKKATILAILISIAIALNLVFVLNFYYQEKQMPQIFAGNEVSVDTGEIVDEEKVPVVIPDKDEVVVFSGVLEEVNVGCFADGECYVVVDGKHITTLLGRNQEVVGKVLGVEGFGDLENFIGEKIEIKAKGLNDGTYTLYGDEYYYVKVLNAASATSRIGEVLDIMGLKISPLAVLEDSRCPIDVECIWAGTLRLRANLESFSGISEQVFVLGESITIENGSIKLVSVEPITDSKTNIDDSEYTFSFQVKQN
jgi:hypothetical protein